MYKLSIIIATYNSASYLRACLSSLRTQKNSWLFQVIIVDKLSSDETVKIALDLFPKCKIISEDDSGIYNALNKGILSATGEWIYVIGSDDVLNDEYVIRDVFSRLLTDTDMIYGNIVSKSGVNKRIIKMKEPHYWIAKKIKCPPIFHQSIFMKRSILIQEDLFDLSFRIHSDHLLIAKCFGKYKSQYIDRTICEYNTTGFSGRRWSTFLQSYKEFHSIYSIIGERKARLIIPLLKNIAVILMHQMGILGRSTR